MAPTERPAESASWRTGSGDTRAYSSAVEHLPYKQGVTGSIPVAPTEASDLRKCCLDRVSRLSTAPNLWLGEKGKRPLTATGIKQMLERRGATIGPRIHPHMFRHGFADASLSSGGTEADLMRLAGWRSRQMLDRYGARVADAHAREAHRRLAPEHRRQRSRRVGDLRLATILGAKHEARSVSASNAAK